MVNRWSQFKYRRALEALDDQVLYSPDDAATHVVTLFPFLHFKAAEESFSGCLENLVEAFGEQPDDCYEGVQWKFVCRKAPMTQLPGEPCSWQGQPIKVPQKTIDPLPPEPPIGSHPRFPPLVLEWKTIFLMALGSWFLILASFLQARSDTSSRDHGHSESWQQVLCDIRLHFERGNLVTVEHLVDEARRRPLSAEANAWCRLYDGRVLVRSGRYDAALHAVNNAHLELTDEVPHMTGHFLMLTAEIYCESEQDEKARVLLGRVRDRHLKSDPALEGDGLMLEARMFFKQGDHARALVRALSARDTYRRCGRDGLETRSMNTIALLTMLVEDPERGLDLTWEARDRMKQHSDLLTYNKINFLVYRRLNRLPVQTLSEDIMETARRNGDHSLLALLQWSLEFDHSAWNRPARQQK